VDAEEVERLAALLGMSLDEFGRSYLRRVGHRLSLVEKAGGDCVFWSAEVGCTVYSARPEQCRTWPFWPMNLEAVEDWARTARGCPGVGRGRVYSVEEILATAARTPS